MKCRHLTCLIIISAFLFAGLPAHANEPNYLIYPQPWCDNTPPLQLHFTMAQLGAEYGTLELPPAHGLVNFAVWPDTGATYLPECESLLETGFDFFQVKNHGNGELINVVIVLSVGDSTIVEVSEDADNGAITAPWEFVQDDLNPKIAIVQWPDNQALSGDYGFRISSAQTEDSFLLFEFEDASSLLQHPPNISDPNNGGGNNGVVTKIIIRPPDDSNTWLNELGEQLIYATEHDDSGPPTTALRLKSEGGFYWVRAEAGAIDGVVETAWCQLADANNAVTIEHFHGADNISDFLRLHIEVEGQSPCAPPVINNFTTARAPAPRHRFGSVSPQLGGVAVDFDLVQVYSHRYDAQLQPAILDDFESGLFNSGWASGMAGNLTVNPLAAHTGYYGLEIQPAPGTPSYLDNVFASGEDEVACHFSLDGETQIGSSSGPTPRIRVFSAIGTGADQIRLWVRQRDSGYQMRAHSGSHNSGWLPLSQLPARIDFRWQSGLLKLWIDGCGADAQNCHVGHQVNHDNWLPANRVRLGDIQTTAAISEAIAIDNVVCLTGPDSNP